MAQLAWPRSAGFAIIILGHLFYVGDGVDIRQLLIQPVSFWLNFPLTNGFKVIIRQGTILHTVETSPSRYRGSAAVFFKGSEKEIRHLASYTVAGQSPSPASCVQACLVRLSVKLGCLGL